MRFDQKGGIFKMAFKKIENYGGSEIPEEYICESTDVKDTENIVAGSTCWELDTKVGFIFDGTTWREV
jgi:hypothetical protein